MYRLVLYYLVFLILAAALMSVFGVLPLSALALLVCAAILLAASWISNKVFAKYLGVQTNVESSYITALILALIITPPALGTYPEAFLFLVWAAVLAMASKYILNIFNKHIFNPAALAVVITSLALNHSATWWIGTPSMFIFVLLGGFLMLRKLRRFGVATAFIAGALVAMIVFTFGQANFFNLIFRTFFYSPLIFFAAVMLTEPLTMPPTQNGRIAYAILVGLMFAPQTHIGTFFFTPELALISGNVFSYLISPKTRHVLMLKEKREIGAGIYNFIFKPDRRFKFKPGQYMEWTLGHKNPDSRGNRRYFTLASSPTEQEVILGVRFYDKPSSFKTNLLTMSVGDTISAGQLAGDFTLPSDLKEKLVFIAGGIGITPFRSMFKYLVDHKERRAITLLYSNRAKNEIVYQDVLYDAWHQLGIGVVCTLTDPVPIDWQGYSGFITPRMIIREVPDYMDRTFYISGSHTMVSSFKESLLQLGVSRRRIKTDFFPGLA